MNEKTKPETTEDLAERGEASENRERALSSRLAVALVVVIAAVFVIYSIISLVGIRSQINERRQELKEIQDKITVQEIKNDEMSKTYNLSEEERSDYIEQIARDDLDYVKEGERVFVNVSGD